jgi:dihydropteroate synthase
MLNEGSDIIDIGGMSSRPGAQIINAEEELNRVIPALKAILSRFPEAIISVDTIHSKVADEALKNGAGIINDISAGRYDKEMIPVVAGRKVPYVIMHMQGMPADMQKNPAYDNVVTEVMAFLAERVKICREAGIIDIIIDPGFGFGKTVEHNYALLRNLALLTHLQLPVLAGLSRKGMIYKILETSAENALNGTSVANTLALVGGAKLLRVHDVKEAVECIKIYNAFQNN